MSSPFSRGLLAGILGMTVTTLAWGQAPPSASPRSGAPRGYLFFAHRNRRAASQPPVKTAADTRAATGQATSDSSLSAIPNTNVEGQTSPEVKQVDWGGKEFGLNYGYHEEGYYPGTPSYGFGAPYPYPLHGYRSTYDWAGHSYSLHCYAEGGYLPWHCPGYRGACYQPGWNDASPPIRLWERTAGRGSCWDCFWHMGGWEHRCSRTDCPYICGPTPAYSSYG
ncbi:MAG: hypothetical protein ACKV0T_08165, partial [Planctomycetales bacterium]